MGTVEKTPDRVAALQSVLLRLSSPGLTLAEASELRSQLEALLDPTNATIHVATSNNSPLRQAC